MPRVVSRHHALLARRGMRAGRRARRAGRGPRRSPDRGDQRAADPRRGTAAATPRPIERIKVSFAADTAVYAPFFIAVDKGYLTEEGLEVEAIQAGGGAATPALISGDLQYSTSAATSVSAILKGAPLKVIFTNADRSLDELWSAAPEVATRGRPGGQVGRHPVARRHDGDRDADGADRSAASIRTPSAIRPWASAASGWPRSRWAPWPPRSSRRPSRSRCGKLPPHGRLLANIREEVQMLYMGVATTDTELQQNRGRAERYLRAVVKGREYFKAYRDETIAIIGKYNQATARANESDYDLTLPGADRGRVDRAGRAAA